jgi:hypothetical protein
MPTTPRRGTILANPIDPVEKTDEFTLRIEAANGEPLAHTEVLRGYPANVDRGVFSILWAVLDAIETVIEDDKYIRPDSLEQVRQALDRAAEA